MFVYVVPLPLLNYTDNGVLMIIRLSDIIPFRFPLKQKLSHPYIRKLADRKKLSKIKNKMCFT